MNRRPKYYTLICNVSDYPIQLEFSSIYGNFKLYVSWKYKAPSKNYCEKIMSGDRNTKFINIPQDTTQEEQLDAHTLYLAISSTKYTTSCKFLVLYSGNK